MQLQLHATWILYAVLLDLGDAVAAALDQPLAALSLELLYRYRYFFTTAYQAGTATDIVAYMAAEAEALGILKPPRARPGTLHLPAVRLDTRPKPLTCHQWAYA